MFQQKFPQMHEDKKAQKLMDKIAKMSGPSEKKQSRADSIQASSGGTQENPRGQARDS